jgi:hypothetical protein
MQLAVMAKEKRKKIMQQTITEDDQAEIIIQKKPGQK